jgi:hypothetical protein
MADFAALLSERGIHLHGNLVGFYRLADGCWVIRQLLDEEIDQAFLDEEPEPSTLEEWIAQVDAMLSELMAMRRGAEMEGPEDAEADEGQARR